MDQKAIYFKLFTSTFYLSTFTFGGGYVIISLMKKKFVDELKWIEENEMLDLAAIAQSAPGAIAVNAALLIGYRVAKKKGALISVIGTVLPPLIILSTISLFYVAFKENPIVSAFLLAMQAGVAAVIFDIVFTMLKDIVALKKWLPIIILVGSFIASYVFKINVMYIILVCGCMGAFTSYKHSREEKKIKQEGEIEQ